MRLPAAGGIRLLKALVFALLAALAALLAAVAPAPLATVDAGEPMTFEARTVSVPGTGGDWYEPAIAISPASGAMYVSGHTTGADGARSAAAVSLDEGVTWKALPSASRVALPVAEGGGQGNEGVIAVDADGHAWLYDAAWIAGSAMLYGWCDDGAELCSVDPMARSPAATATASCGAHAVDRPWVQFGHGKLVLVNNGLYNLTGNPVVGPPVAHEIGVYDPGTGAVDWNLCAGEGGFPGYPAVRASDGMIAAPQVRGLFEDIHLALAVGTDVRALETRRLFDVHTYWIQCQAFNGHAAFDAAGNFYAVAATSERSLGIAASRDLERFGVLELPLAPDSIRYLWVSGSPTGEGALVTWATHDGDCNRGTFHAAHVRPGAEPGSPPVVTDSSVVVDDAGTLCGHYYGNALTPDGRAALVVYASPNGCQALPGVELPVRVYVQTGGPTL